MKAAPRYVVRYDDEQLYQQALQKAGGESDKLDSWDFECGREVSTLPAAKSVKRALERRGHCVHGIYERVNIRESWEWHSDEYKARHSREMEWEWDEERCIDE